MRSQRLLDKIDSDLRQFYEIDNSSLSKYNESLRRRLALLKGGIDQDEFETFKNIYKQNIDGIKAEIQALKQTQQVAAQQAVTQQATAQQVAAQQVVAQQAIAQQVAAQQAATQQVVIQSPAPVASAISPSQQPNMDSLTTEVQRLGRAVDQLPIKEQAVRDLIDNKLNLLQNQIYQISQNRSNPQQIPQQNPQILTIQEQIKNLAEKIEKLDVKPQIGEDEIKKITNDIIQLTEHHNIDPKAHPHLQNLINTEKKDRLEAARNTRKNLENHIEETNEKLDEGKTVLLNTEKDLREKINDVKDDILTKVAENTKIIGNVCIELRIGLRRETEARQQGLDELKTNLDKEKEDRLEAALVAKVELTNLINDNRKLININTNKINTIDIKLKKIDEEQKEHADKLKDFNPEIIRDLSNHKKEFSKLREKLRKELREELTNLQKQGTDELREELTEFEVKIKRVENEANTKIEDAILVMENLITNELDTKINKVQESIDKQIKSIEAQVVGIQNTVNNPKELNNEQFKKLEKSNTQLKELIQKLKSSQKNVNTKITGLEKNQEILNTKITGFDNRVDKIIEDRIENSKTNIKFFKEKQSSFEKTMEKLEENVDKNSEQLRKIKIIEQNVKDNTTNISKNETKIAEFADKVKQYYDQGILSFSTIDEVKKEVLEMKEKNLIDINYKNVNKKLEIINQKIIDLNLSDIEDKLKELDDKKLDKKEAFDKIYEKIYEKIFENLKNRENKIDEKLRKGLLKLGKQGKPKKNFIKDNKKRIGSLFKEDISMSKKIDRGRPFPPKPLTPNIGDIGGGGNKMIQDLDILISYFTYKKDYLEEKLNSPIKSDLFNTNDIENLSEKLKKDDSNVKEILSDIDDNLEVEVEKTISELDQEINDKNMMLNVLRGIPNAGGKKTKLNPAISKKLENKALIFLAKISGGTLQRSRLNIIYEMENKTTNQEYIYIIDVLKYLKDVKSKNENEIELCMLDPTLSKTFLIKQQEIDIEILDSNKQYLDNSFIKEKDLNSDRLEEQIQGEQNTNIVQQKIIGDLQKQIDNLKRFDQDFPGILLKYETEIKRMNQELKTLTSDMGKINEGAEATIASGDKQKIEEFIARFETSIGEINARIAEIGSVSSEGKKNLSSVEEIHRSYLENFIKMFKQLNKDLENVKENIEKLIPGNPQLRVLELPTLEQLKITVQELFEQKKIGTGLLTQINKNLTNLKTQQEYINKNTELKRNLDDIIAQTETEDLGKQLSNLVTQLSKLYTKLEGLQDGNIELVIEHDKEFSKLKNEFVKTIDKINKLYTNVDNIKVTVDKVKLKECNLKREKLRLEIYKLKKDQEFAEEKTNMEIKECMTDIEDIQQKIDSFNRIAKSEEVELMVRKKELETKLRMYQITFKGKVELINSSIEISDIENLNIRIKDFDEELLKLKGNLETFPDNQRIKDFISEQEKILKVKIKQKERIEKEKLEKESKEAAVVEPESVPKAAAAAVELGPASSELPDNIIDIDGLLKHETSDVKNFSNEKLQTEMKKVERGNQQLKNNIIEKLSKLSDNFEKSVSMISSDTEEPLLDNIKNSLAVKKNGGGKKPADELYNQVVFTKGGGIKKLNLKKSKYKEEINKIVDNLINNLNKSGGTTMKERSAKKIQEKQENLDRNKLDEDWQGKISLLKKYKESLGNINEYVEFYNKNMNFYNNDKKNTESIDTTTYNFSIGELANYESIMRNILDLLKIFGLSDLNDEIFNDLQSLFDKIGVIEESKKTDTEKDTEIDTLFEEVKAEESKGSKVLRFFDKPEYMIELRWEGETQIKELNSKMVHMDNNKIKELIALLKKLYEKHYLMIVRYQKLFSQIKGNKDVQATDSIVIRRDKGATTLQKELLIFFVIRDILDDYLVLTRRPVSIYARINDVGRFEKKEGETLVQDFDVAKKTCYEMVESGENESNYMKKWINMPSGVKNTIPAYPKDVALVKKLPFVFCKLIQPTDFIQWSEKDPKNNPGGIKIRLYDEENKKVKCITGLSEQNEERLLSETGEVKFSEIFFRPEFNDNETISQYMLLDKLINKRIGTYLVTYGYSGVGKSYTLFGSKEAAGLLQATVNNITTKYKTFKSVEVRIYELYGLALGYSECYEDYNKIDQSVFHYDVKVASDKTDIGEGILANKLTSYDTLELRGDDIPSYVKKINSYNQGEKVGNTKFKYFTEMPKNLNYFSELVGYIEKQRASGNYDEELKRSIYPKRVKPTVNNPVSSRAKIVYDFMFNFEDVQQGTTWQTPLIIDDTPGAENLLESYIYNNKKINETTLNSIKKYKSDPLKIQTTTVSWEFAMLCAGLVQPLWLGFLNANGVIVGYNKLVTLLEKSSLREERITNYASYLIGALKAKFPKVAKNITGTNIPVRPLIDIKLMDHPDIVKFTKEIRGKNQISINSLTKENRNTWRKLIEKYGQEALSEKFTNKGKPKFEQYIKHLKGGGSGSPRKNDNDYCQIMYPAYEGKVVMDQLESIETDQDKETWKSYIRTKKASFYATGIETEENNMKLAYNIIRETILYCKDKEGIETKLLKGEYKYDLFIELLTSIFELSSIISLGDGGETEAQKTLNNIINSGNATEFADFWNSLELGVKESALSSSSFFNNWVSYFNRNIDKKAYRKDSFYNKKKLSIEDWSTAIESTSKVNNGDSWVSLFLGYDNEQYKKNAIINVFNNVLPKKIKDKHNRFYKSSAWVTFVTKAHTEYNKSKDKGYFIKYLIKKKVIKEDLIKKWAIALKKVVDVEVQNTIDPEAVAKTREFMKTFITLAMESWYINQNISGILKKCSEVSGILPDVIEDDIVQYRKDYTINSESEKSIVDEFLEGVNRPSKPNPKGDTTGSMEGNITKIEEYISKYRTNPLKITNEFIKYCQDTYKPDALFPVVTFPEDLAGPNKKVYDFFKGKIMKDGSDVNRETNLKNWAKKKTDTVVGALMQPYFDKGMTLEEEFSEQPVERKSEKSSIEDFKMFYVIQNNKTTLKCYDQLKVFSKFSNFIKQVMK